MQQTKFSLEKERSKRSLHSELRVCCSECFQVLHSALVRGRWQGPEPEFNMGVRALMDRSKKTNDADRR